MTEFSVHTELFRRGATDPLADWLLATGLLFGGVLAAALIGAALATPRSAAMRDPPAAELSSMTAIISPAAQSVPTAAAGSAAVAQSSFAFGFLEFDWDPNAPGGVPGFDSLATRDLRVADASTRN